MRGEEGERVSSRTVGAGMRGRGAHERGVVLCDADEFVQGHGVGRECTGEGTLGDEEGTRGGREREEEVTGGGLTRVTRARGDAHREREGPSVRGKVYGIGGRAVLCTGEEASARRCSASESRASRVRTLPLPSVGHPSSHVRPWGTTTSTTSTPPTWTTTTTSFNTSTPQRRTRTRSRQPRLLPLTRSRSLSRPSTTRASDHTPSHSHRVTPSGHSGPCSPAEQRESPSCARSPLSRRLAATLAARTRLAVSSAST